MNTEIKNNATSPTVENTTENLPSRRKALKIAGMAAMFTLASKLSLNAQVSEAYNRFKPAEMQELLNDISASSAAQSEIKSDRNLNWIVGQLEAIAKSNQGSQFDADYQEVSLRKKNSGELTTLWRNSLEAAEMPNADAYDTRYLEMAQLASDLSSKDFLLCKSMGLALSKAFAESETGQDLKRRSYDYYTKCETQLRLCGFTEQNPAVLMRAVLGLNGSSPNSYIAATLGFDH